MTLDDFLQAIVADPHNASTTWAVLADWLEDQGDPRWEFVRLLHQREYRSDMRPEDRDERVRQLLASGMQPIAPSIINSIGMRLVLIPAGIFLMESPDGEGYEDEHPQHEVEITTPFFLGAFSVTQEQYQRVMGKNPSAFCATGTMNFCVEGMDTKRFPFETVSWNAAITVCQLLSNRPEEKTAGRSYYLPTEAEWEYACRGGAVSYSRFHYGAFLHPTQANSRGSNLRRPCPVGSYPANGFGLFDMHGNVEEWCLDWYDRDYYKRSSKRDLQGPDKGDGRVMRGGSWLKEEVCARSAARSQMQPATHHYTSGFRVAFRLD
jgi:uncharacterized protein (TIGR02996 family)